VKSFQNYKNKENILSKFHYKTLYIQYAMALQKHDSPQTNEEEEEEEESPLHLPFHPPKKVDFSP